MGLKEWLGGGKKKQPEIERVEVIGKEVSAEGQEARRQQVSSEMWEQEQELEKRIANADPAMKQKLQGMLDKIREQRRDQSIK